jgi:tRNA(Leu) C34 or U34 (ribose-2'-O)-methylase TrmL
MSNKNLQVGTCPAIALVNPKYLNNVVTAVRLASGFNFKQVWFSGNRISFKDKERTNPEEHMHGYKDVELIQYDYFFDQFPSWATPVAVELRPNAEPLTTFVHPDNAVYVFGPEDGSLHRMHLALCHRFVVIPTRRSLHLTDAICIVLYDRYIKRLQSGLELDLSISELLGAT